MNAFIRLTLYICHVMNEIILVKLLRHFEIQREWNFCPKVNEAHQDLIHEKLVNFYELKNNWVFFFVPFIDKMMIYGSSSHTVSNLHGKRKGLFQGCWQYCFHYNVYWCRKVLNHNGEWNFFLHKVMKNKSCQARKVLHHAQNTKSFIQTWFCLAKKFIPFANLWIFPKRCTKIGILP